METLTVTQLTRAVRGLLEEEIGEVWVEGEVSNCRLQASGHRYFTLKDAQAQLSCVFFRGHARINRTPIENGVKLRLFGELSVYEARGQYQLVVKAARALGAGDLHERFEALKLKLREEGLFEESRKRALPRFPRRLAIVTSPTGAVIRDLLSVLGRRAPWVEVWLYPVRVQGEGAHGEIIEALENLGRREEIDAIVLARGGGSLEDLWCFNEEKLARAVVACPIPVVSAVGHETDFTIADFVADLRAPTPSAAAELIVPDQKELRQWLAQRRRQLTQTVEGRLAYWAERLAWCRRSGAFQRPRRVIVELSQRLDDRAQALEGGVALGLDRRSQALEAHRRALRMLSPEKQFARMEERLKERRDRLRRALKHQWRQKRERLATLERHLRTLGPSQTLARGYAILLDEKRQPIATVNRLQPGSAVTARLHDGEALLKVDAEEHRRGGQSKKKAAKAKKKVRAPKKNDQR